MLIFFCILNGVSGSTNDVKIQLVSAQAEEEMQSDKNEFDKLDVSINLDPVLNLDNTIDKVNSFASTAPSETFIYKEIKINLNSLQADSQYKKDMEKILTLVNDKESFIQRYSTDGGSMTLKNENQLCRFLELEVIVPEDINKYLNHSKIQNVLTMFFLYITYFNGLVYTPLYYYPLELVHNKFIKSQKSSYIYVTGWVLRILVNILGFLISSGQRFAIQALFPETFSNMIPSVLLCATFSTLSYIDWIFLRHPCHDLTSKFWHVPAVKYKKTFHLFIFFFMFISIFSSWMIRIYMPHF